MLNLLIHLIIDASAAFFSSRKMTTIHVKGLHKAFFLAFIISFISIAIGWLFTTSVNIIELGVINFLCLGFLTRTIIYVLVIQLSSMYIKGFRTDGFWSSLWLAILLALLGSVIDCIIL